MIQLSAPKQPVTASIKLSGSKSISNRLLMLNSILNTALRIENLSDSEDTTLLAKALHTIKNKREAVIDVHHAGTDMRFLAALLTVKEGKWTLTGSERMKNRPVGELVSALKTLGADMTYLEQENYPPLFIQGKPLKGGRVTINSSVSSQFISALLLIAAQFEKGLHITLTGETVSRPYIDMTIALMKELGISVHTTGQRIEVLPCAQPSRGTVNFPDSYTVEPDWSSASYWYSFCALSKQAEIELAGLKKESLQADAILPELYKDLGVKTTFTKNGLLLTSVEPTSQAFCYDFKNCPDIAQTLAVTCFGLNIPASLTGLSTLKIKETDRLAALKTELEKFGAQVAITDNSMNLLPGKVALKSSKAPVIKTYNDHRMAMSFAPLVLVSGSLCINGAEVVAKSYPGFWEDLKSVGFNVNLQS